MSWWGRRRVWKMGVGGLGIGLFGERLVRDELDGENLYCNEMCLKHRLKHSYNFNNINTPKSKKMVENLISTFYGSRMVMWLDFFIFMIFSWLCRFCSRHFLLLGIPPSCSWRWRSSHFSHRIQSLPQRFHTIIRIVDMPSNESRPEFSPEFGCKLNFPFRWLYIIANPKQPC